MKQHSINNCRWTIRISVETMFGFMNLVILGDRVRNEQICSVCTYCRSYLCSCSWHITICHIWPVVGVSSIMDATCGSGSYLPSLTFVSNSSFNWVAVAQTLVFYCGPLFAFGSLSFWPLSFGMSALVTQMLSSGFPYTYWVSNCHCI
jgi:hypothetical protein